MRALIVLVILLGLSSAIARPTNSCFTNELSPLTNKKYKSFSEYSHEKKQWAKLKPTALVNPVQLILAYKVFTLEEDYAKSLSSDKAAHCYIGCRVGQETSLRTAYFMSWYKESLDLTDCNASTRFEYQDHSATIYGANLSSITSHPYDCASLCAMNFKK